MIWAILLILACLALIAGFALWLSPLQDDDPDYPSGEYDDNDEEDPRFP